MTKEILVGWAASGLMLVLVAILARRGLYKRFPVFFAYCVATLMVAVLRFAADRDPMTYFFVYWSTEASYLVIAFLAMLSVLRPLTRFEYVRHPWSRFVLAPIVLLIFATSSWFAAFRPISRSPAAHSATARFASAVYVFVILMCVLELLLFIESFRVRGRYPIKWTPYEFGILQGFAALAFVNLIAYLPLIFRLYHLHVGHGLESVFQSFPPGAFIASAVAWLLVFSRPEPPRPEVPDIGTLYDALHVLEEQLEIVREVARRLGLHVLSPVTR
jgi:hypothetical protein